VKIAVFAKGDKAREAEEAGADYVGADELAKRIEEESWTDFDVAIATPDMMPVVGKPRPRPRPAGQDAEPEGRARSRWTWPRRSRSRRPARSSTAPTARDRPPDARQDRLRRAALLENYAP
jgi:hypothetical protein